MVAFLGAKAAIVGLIFQKETYAASAGLMEITCCEVAAPARKSQQGQARNPDISAGFPAFVTLDVAGGNELQICGSSCLGSCAVLGKPGR